VHRPRFAAIPPNIFNIVKTRDGRPFTVRYALQSAPPRARHVATRATARAIRVEDDFDQPILGQLRSSVILVFKIQRNHILNPSYRAERYCDF